MSSLNLGRVQGASVWKVSNYSISDDGTLVGTITPESGVTIKPLVGDLAIITAAASNGSSEYIGWLCKITLVASGTLVTLEPIVSLKGDGAGDFATEEDINNIFSPEDELLGTWYFNEPPRPKSMQKVNFISNGIKFNAFYSYIAFPWESLYRAERDTVVYHSDRGWTNSAYRTIVIYDTSNVEDREYLITFLKSNATKLNNYYPNEKYNSISVSLENLRIFKSQYDEEVNEKDNVIKQDLSQEINYLSEEVENLKNNGSDSGGVASSSKKHLNLELGTLYRGNLYESKKALDEVYFFANTYDGVEYDGLDFNFVWNGNATMRDCRAKRSPRLRNNKSHVNEKVDFRKSNINFQLADQQAGNALTVVGLTIYDVLSFIFDADNLWLDSQFEAVSSLVNRTDICVYSKRDLLLYNADNMIALMPLYYFDMGDRTVNDICHLINTSFSNNVSGGFIQIDNSFDNETNVINTGSGYSKELIINLKPVINYQCNYAQGWSGDMNSSSIELRIQFTSNNIGQQEGNIAMIMYISIEKVD